MGILQINFDCIELPVDSLAAFMEFSSEVYPALCRHYWFATQRRIEQNQGRAAAR
jgi:hypothetical protein